MKSGESDEGSDKNGDSRDAESAGERLERRGIDDAVILGADSDSVGDEELMEEVELDTTLPVSVEVDEAADEPREQGLVRYDSLSAYLREISRIPH